MSEGQRRLAAIMYTDIVGYTSLAQKDESSTLQALENHRRLLRPHFSSHGGREIKTMGDAFLVEFQSALDALLCSMAIQQVMHDRKLATGDTISLRIGIHVGDVVERENDILGDAVNIASRIEPLAEAGGVCISGEVYSQVRNKSDLPFVSLGEKSLKNVNTPVTVYKAVMPWEKEGEGPAPQLDPKRVAVLPFVSMSPDPNDEYFADGLTEELITRMSLVRGLEVIARTSVMSFKKKDKKVSEIGKELKVGTLLEGSVRKAGNRIRVSAQLINANTEGHLWAENYDRNLEDIFEVQSSVAEKVAGALKLRLLDEDRERVEPTADMNAYTMYLRAMQLYHEATEKSYREAIALFKEAISKDPTFVRAYVGLAQAWWELKDWAEFATCVNRAEVAARKALELGPESAEAHAAMAAVHEAMDRFEKSRLELERAIRINPNLAEANQWLGFLHATFGRFDEAIECLQKACSLDPLAPGPAMVLTRVLRVAGKVDEALELAERFKEAHRTMIYYYIVMCYLQKKDFARANEELDIGLRLDPDDDYLRIARGGLYALLGKREEALAELRDLMTDEAESHRLDAQLVIRTALGDLDEAFEALMREAELHSWSGLIKYDPLYEGLQKDPRFPEFCKKVGLPP